MRHGIRALCWYTSKKDPCENSNLYWNGRGITTSRARNCERARVALACYDRPDVIFTATVLPDGTWQEILALAEETFPPVPVIVVSRMACVQLFLDTLEGGASDFIVPPFRDDEIAHIVTSAVLRRSESSLGVPGVTGGTATEVDGHAQNDVR